MDMDHIDKEYIDVDDALRRVGGNMDLYKRLLGRFIEGDSVELLENALGSGDMEEASRLAHTIKGVSANLSLEKIRSISVDLEQAIKCGSDHSSIFSQLKDAHKSTAQRIAEMA